MKSYFIAINKIIKEYDLLPKMLAILLAVILWANLQSSQIGEITYNIYPEIRNLPEDLIVLEDIPKIPVTLRGKNELIKTINPSNVMLYIDFSKYVIGSKHLYAIKLKTKEMINNVEYVIKYDHLELTIHKMKSKSIPLEAEITGEVMPQYKKGIILIQPQQVKISGAEPVIDAIESLKTYPINIGDLNQTVKMQVQVNRSNYSKITVIPEFVRVTVPIVPVTSLIQVSVPIEIRNRRNDLNYNLKNKKVVVYIRKTDAVIEIDEASLAAFIDGDAHTQINASSYLPIEVEKKAKFPFEIFTYEPLQAEVIITNYDQ